MGSARAFTMSADTINRLESEKSALQQQLDAAKANQLDADDIAALDAADKDTPTPPAETPATPA